MNIKQLQEARSHVSPSAVKALAHRNILIGKDRDFEQAASRQSFLPSYLSTLLATYVPDDKRPQFTQVVGQFPESVSPKVDHTSPPMSSASWGHADSSDPHASAAFAATPGTPIGGHEAIHIATDDDDEDEDRAWKDDAWPERKAEDDEIPKFEPMPVDPDYTHDLNEDDENCALLLHEPDCMPNSLNQTLGQTLLTLMKMTRCRSLNLHLAL